jgi:hypothetical protein
MDPDSLPSAASMQASLFDFAITELVRRHRDSFAPLWTAESWAKLLIWLALNCGCDTDSPALEAFADALGPLLSARMRRVFFERDLEDLGLRVMADPAEQQVLVLPLAAPHGALEAERVALVLERLGLLGHVTADRSRWQRLEQAMALPWS